MAAWLGMERRKQQRRRARGASHDSVSELLELLKSHHSELQSEPAGTPRQLAAGGLVRAEGLLRGLRILVRAKREDLAGLLVRSVWECWCVGIYVVLGGPEKLAELEETYLRWLRTFTERWPGSEPLVVDDNVLAGLGGSDPAPNLEEMDGRVRAMLARSETAPVGLTEVSSYQVIYRLESTFSTHAGSALFSRYLTADKHGSLERVVEAPTNHTLREKSAPLAAAFVSHLAWHVYEEFCIDTEGLAQLMIRLFQEAEAYRPTSPS